MCRVEPPDAPVQSCREPPQRVIEKILGRGTESASACYLNEKVCIHGALVNGDLNLRGNRQRLSAGCLRRLVP